MCSKHRWHKIIIKTINKECSPSLWSGKSKTVGWPSKQAEVNLRITSKVRQMKCCKLLQQLEEVPFNWVKRVRIKFIRTSKDIKCRKTEIEESRILTNNFRDPKKRILIWMTGMLKIKLRLMRKEIWLKAKTEPRRNRESWTWRISKGTTLTILCRLNLPLKNVFCTISSIGNQDRPSLQNRSKDRPTYNDLRGVWYQQRPSQVRKRLSKFVQDFRTFVAIQIWEMITDRFTFSHRQMKMSRYLLEEAQLFNHNLSISKSNTDSEIIIILLKDLSLINAGIVCNTWEASKIKIRSSLLHRLPPIHSPTLSLKFIEIWMQTLLQLQTFSPRPNKLRSKQFPRQLKSMIFLIGLGRREYDLHKTKTRLPILCFLPRSWDQLPQIRKRKPIWIVHKSMPDICQHFSKDKNKEVHSCLFISSLQTRINHKHTKMLRLRFALIKQFSSLSKSWEPNLDLNKKVDQKLRRWRIRQLG